MNEETDLGVTDLPLAVEVQERIARWLVEPRYADLRPALVELVRAARGGDPAALTELADAFSQILPIGTGGRRGKVAPGPNRFNRVVLRETAQGIADALHAAGDPPKVAIVYDTRRDSRAFSRVVAETLVDNRIDVLLVDAPRPTPALSFLVRHAGCGAGVVISASHNPPEDNGIKIYGPDGAQVLGARDAALMQAILRAAAPAGESDRDPATGPIDGASGRLEILEGPAIAAEVDAPYHAYVAAQGVADDDLSAIHLPIAFTPLHGVGHTSVLPVLRSRGFQVEALPSQVDPDDGNFSTVASANPELPESMTLVKAFAREIGAELVIATDPDADRIGACAVASGDPGADFIAIDGNRLGVLMLYHILRHRPPPPRGWILTTLVTSPLIASLAWAAGVEVVDDLLVGFKHHAGMLAEAPDRPLVFGCEESHGYMRGNGIRDKDGAIAALLLSECAAVAKRAGKRLFDVLAEIWCAHGYHRERTANLIAPGLAGRQAIAAVMDAWRAAPPPAFAGLEVLRVEDRAQPRSTGSPTRDLPGNVLVFELSAGARACRLVLRPSGTEPKLKIYALARAEGSCTAAELPGIIAEVDALTDRVLADAETAARAVMAPVLEA